MLEDLLPEYVEIETSTYCNRTCSWCPNSTFQRSRAQNLMPENLFDKIVNDLKGVNYSGQIALHNYNEPLMDPHLFSHIARVKQKLPGAKILILTNGDLLDVEYC